MSAADGPLAAVRVLDLGRLLPAGFATLILAELGADVVKVEAPPSGDPSRHIAPFQGAESHHHLAVNRGKRSLCLDLKGAEGRGVFLRLADSADVVLDNFRPGVAERLGIDYAILGRRNPRLIYCALSGFGQDGPYRLRAGFDLTLLAATGILSLMPRGAQGVPALPGVLLADAAAGLWTAIALLAALAARERTGRGQFVDVAMFDTTLSLLTIAAGRFFAEPRAPAPGDFTGGSACWNVYETADGGFIALGAYERGFWQRFCAAAGRPDLAPYHFGNPDRRDWVLGEVRTLFRQRTRADWEAILARADVPSSPVLSLREVFADPHVAARGLVGRHPQPGVGRVRHLRLPLRFSATPAGTRRPAPGLGEGAEAVLAEAGFTAEEVDGLLARGVLAASGRGPAAAPAEVLTARESAPPEGPRAQRRPGTTRQPSRPRSPGRAPTGRAPTGRTAGVRAARPRSG